MNAFRLTGMALAAALLFAPLSALAETKLLNVSYDVSREFYKDYNAAFAKHWKAKTGEDVTINQSHGGSGKQARAVIDGLEADVVTMNQGLDIDSISTIGKLIDPNWSSEFPHKSSPYLSTIVFLVRKGNPKGIKDWADLTREGVSVVIPNPKTSGNGRFSYLAAWGYAVKKQGADEAKAREFVGKLFKNVPVLDTGGRGATTTFMQRGIGDVLLTFEAEVDLIRKDIEGAEFDVVIPSLSIEAEAPVAIVDKVVDKRGTRKVAQAYLEHLFSPEGQALAAKHHFRPRSGGAASFPKVNLFKAEELFGDWTGIQKQHFADGGIFDSFYK